MNHAERSNDLVSSNQIKTRAGEEVVRDAADRLEAADQEFALISVLVPGSGSVLDRVRAQTLELAALKEETAVRQAILRDVNHRLEETTDQLNDAIEHEAALSILVPGKGSLFNRVSKLVEKSRKSEPADMAYGLTAALRLERVYQFRRRMGTGFIESRRALEENDYDVLAAAARWQTGWRPSSLDLEG
jgi:hypothetical protein